MKKKKKKEKKEEKKRRKKRRKRRKRRKEEKKKKKKKEKEEEEEEEMQSSKSNKPHLTGGELKTSDHHVAETNARNVQTNDVGISHLCTCIYIYMHCVFQIKHIWS